MFENYLQNVKLCPMALVCCLRFLVLRDIKKEWKKNPCESWWHSIKPYWTNNQRSTGLEPRKKFSIWHRILKKKRELFIWAMRGDESPLDGMQISWANEAKTPTKYWHFNLTRFYCLFIRYQLAIDNVSAQCKRVTMKIISVNTDWSVTMFIRNVNKRFPSFEHDFWQIY